jgi:hypothetical protein
MSVETMEKPQTEEKEQKCEDTNEKCKKCKEKQDFENELYDGLKKFCESKDFLESKESYISEIKSSDEGLPRFYRELVEQNKIQEKDLLWEFLATVTAADQVAECIINEVGRRAAVLHYLEQDITKDNYVIIKSTEGTKVGVALVPICTIEENNLDTDEKIIAFHKENMPGMCSENATFEVLRGKDFEAEFAKSKDLLTKHLKGEK